MLAAETCESCVKQGKVAGDETVVKIGVSGIYESFVGQRREGHSGKMGIAGFNVRVTFL